MIMRKIILFMCAGLLFSCGTLFTGTTEVISFNSVPGKADIKFDGLDMGKTPLTLEVSKSFKGVVSIEKDGYDAHSFKLQRSFNSTSILNLGNLLGWGIDFATGAISNFDRKGYDLELDKEE